MLSSQARELRPPGASILRDVDLVSDGSRAAPYFHSSLTLPQARVPASRCATAMASASASMVLPDVDQSLAVPEPVPGAWSNIESAVQGVPKATPAGLVALAV
jgi:hypothetical protein